MKKKNTFLSYLFFFFGIPTIELTCSFYLPSSLALFVTFFFFFFHIYMCDFNVFDFYGFLSDFFFFMVFFFFCSSMDFFPPLHHALFFSYISFMLITVNLICYRSLSMCALRKWTIHRYNLQIPTVTLANPPVTLANPVLIPFHSFFPVCLHLAGGWSWRYR